MSWDSSKNLWMVVNALIEMAIANSNNDAIMDKGTAAVALNG